MDKVLYTRISENRDAQFLLRTQIIETGHQRFVKKSPVYESGQTFLDLMFANQKKLIEMYANNKNINVLESEKKDNSLYFPFVEASTLESYLDDYLFNNDFSNLLKEMKNYFNALSESVELYDFKETKEFQNIFGNHDELVGLKALPISNIDSLFRNVFKNSNNYTMYDIEWTMDFLVPIEYIFYRCIFWYQIEEQRKSYLHDLNLFKLFNINEHLLTVYASMEDSFQRNCRGNKIPLWQLHTAIDRMALTLDEYISRTKNEYKNQVTVYENYGNGFSEETAVKYEVFPEEGSLHLKIKLHSDLQTLRLDPGEKSCGIVVHYMVIKDNEIKNIEYHSNGLEIEKDYFIFINDDPQFIFGEGININGYLELEISRCDINVDYMQKILTIFKRYDSTIKDMQSDFDNAIHIKKEEIEEMQLKFKNEISELQLALNDKDQVILEKDVKLEEKDTHINNLNEILEAIKNSRWQRLGKKLHVK